MSNKSQVTVFIILGLVIFIIIGFSLFMVSMITESDLESRAQEAVRDRLDASPVDHYIASCLQDATKDSIIEISERGGMTEEEAEELSEDTYVEVDDTIIHLSIMEENKDDCIGDECQRIIPSHFPIRDTFFRDYMDKYSQNYIDFPRPSSGYLGYNNLTRLCDIQGGPNVGMIEEAENPCYFATRHFDGILNINFQQPEDSIEHKLSELILTETNECIDHDLLDEAMGSDITLLSEEGNESTLFFDPYDFTSMIEYHFRVRLQGEEPVIIQYEFDHDSDIRFNRLYRFAMSAIAEDTQTPVFNISDENYYEEVDGYLDGFEVEVIDYVERELEDGTVVDDRVIEFRDIRSLMDGEELFFRTATQDRKPILNYITNTPPGHRFDLLFVEGDNITIDPEGVDPDSGTVSYDYGLWAEDYKEVYLHDKDECDFESEDFEGFHESDDDAFNEMVDRCIERIDGAPSNWTLSELFLDTERMANYETNRSDIGPRVTRVQVEDKYERVRYQDLDIFILDLPLPRVNVSHPDGFEDVPDNITSVEDYFYLDGSDSISSQLLESSISSYIWNAYILDDDGEKDKHVFEKTTSNPLLRVPGDLDEYDYDRDDYSYIQNITEKPLTKDNLGKRYLFTLNVTVGDLDPPYDEADVQAQNVTEAESRICLPVRIDDDPYPYNSSNNAFKTNHTCCAGDLDDPDSYELEDESNTCFETKLYGKKSLIEEKEDSLLRQDLLKSYFETDVAGSYDVDSSGSYGDFNDVHIIDFERQCDGNRGNICAGDVDYSIEVEECTTHSTYYGSEQCVGPEEHDEVTEDELSCDYYEDETYDSIFRGGSDICNEIDPNAVYCASYSNGDYIRDDDGPRIVEGDGFTCDGSGGCSKASDSTCDVEDCDAECDGDKEYESEGSGSNRVCNYGCDLGNSCEFNYEDEDDFNVYSENGEQICEWHLECGEQGFEEQSGNNRNELPDDEDISDCDCEYGGWDCS